MSRVAIKIGLPIHSFQLGWCTHTHTHTEATPTAQQSLSSSSSSSLTCFSCHFYLSSQGNQFTMCLFVSRLLFLLRQTERRTDRRTDDRRDRQADRETDRPVNSLAPFLGFGYYDNPTRPSNSLRTSLFATFLAIFKHFCSYACFTSYLFDCPTGGRAGELSQSSWKGGRGSRQLSSGMCVYVCTAEAATPQRSPCFPAAKSCVLNPQVTSFPLLSSLSLGAAASSRLSFGQV